MKTPDASLHTPHLRWDKKNALVGLVVLVLLVAGGLVWYFAFRKDASPASTVPQYSGQKLVDELNKHYGANDFVGAIGLLKGQKTINTPEVQLLLASAYSNKGDYKESLNIYNGLDRGGNLSAENTASAAEVAEKAKEYGQAATYYDKAANRMEKESNFVQDLPLLYRQKAEEMRSKV
jgi:tetratricopeptide (TPR) repeat protein